MRERTTEESARSHSRSLCGLAVPKKACRLVSAEPHDEKSARSHSRSLPTRVITRFGNFRLPLSRMAEIIAKDGGFIADPFSEKARFITPFTGPAISGTHFPPP